MNDCVIEFLRKHNIPLTRENYISVAYLGQPPDELDAEVEGDIARAFAHIDDEFLRSAGIEPLEEDE